MESGTVESYEKAEGRGVIQLASGDRVRFTWDQVELRFGAPVPGVRGLPVDKAFEDSNIGHGHALRVGADVLYDVNDKSRPVKPA